MTSHHLELEFTPLDEYKVYVRCEIVFPVAAFPWIKTLKLSFCNYVALFCISISQIRIK